MTGGAAEPERHAGRPRVLLVEDEFLVAMMVEDMLGDLGFEVAGIAQNLSAAENAATSGSFDAAVLDINLNGAMSYPVAEILARRHIPFIFATGYGRAGADEMFPDIPALEKPFERGDLGDALAAVLGRRH